MILDKNRLLMIAPTSYLTERPSSLSIVDDFKKMVTKIGRVTTSSFKKKAKKWPVSHPSHGDKML